MSDSVQLPATLPRPGDPKTLYVVDISAYVFRAYYALPPLSNDKGEATHAVQGVANMLHKFIRERNPAYLAIAMDSRARTLRKERYEAYKANRSKAPEDLKSQMIRVREVVEAAGMATYEAPGYEADDVIATVVRWASKQGLNAVIVSGDKDLLQLIDAKTWMYDTSRDRVFGPAETEAKMGVPPHQVRDLLALTGDSSDNVPGVPSVGPKTATK